MSIANLVIPYDDFVLNTEIDPEQFDTNNAVIESKVNELVTSANSHETRVASLEAGIPYNALQQQAFTATEGQVLFTLDGEYTVGQHLLAVYVSGVRQTVGVGFTETSSTSFTLTEALPAGTQVLAEFLEPYLGIVENFKTGVFAYDNAGIGFAGATTTEMVFGFEVVDNKSEYNNSTGVFTATKSGMYSVYASLISAASLASGNVLKLVAYKSTDGGGSYAEDTVVAYGVNVASGVQQIVGSAQVYLAAGNKLKFKIYSTNAGATSASEVNTQLKISKIW